MWRFGTFTHCGCAVCALVAGLLPVPADAAAVFLEGTVVDVSGAPVAGAGVILSRANLRLVRTSDAAGRFVFTPLVRGRYELAVSKGDLRAVETIDVGSSPLVLRISLGAPQTIERAVVVRNPPAGRSGTDVAMDGAEISRLPGGSSLSAILMQLPSAAQGSNGQIHVNGNHNGLNYYIDGVQVPANLNRVLGGEIDPSDIGYLDVLEGAYPAQYGDRFAAVLDVGTKSYAGSPGYDFSTAGGSYATYQSSLSLHAPVGANGGSLTVAGFMGRTGWSLDPPVTDPTHNAGSDTNGFLRLSLPFGADALNFDAISSLQTFQIPPDTSNGVPASTDDNEYQSDQFLALQYRHAFGQNGVVQFGPSLKVSNILDTNDLQNDLAAGGPPPAPGQINCIDFTDCIFSVFADRTARDYRFNVDAATKSAHHEVRAGALYDASTILVNDAITLQPYSALDRTGSFAAYDTAPNVAHQQEAYVQDDWSFGPYLLAYGLRADAFQIFSTNFDKGYSQVSPRIKLARTFGSRASAYAYYGRLFVPFSFENVNPATAAELYYAPPPNTFDLRPERDSLYEAGGHVPVGRFDAGLRLMHEVSTDWLDDTQVGATNLHQDINFPEGRVDLQSLYVQESLARGGRLSVSVTHTLAVNSLICETNLLQNCTLGGYVTGPSAAPVPYYVSPGGGFVQADHDQHWTAGAAWLTNDNHGGWLSLTGEYGSGLSTGDPAQIVPGPPAYAYAADSACSTLDAVNCKVAPHMTFGVEKGVALGERVTASLSILNILNDRCAITQDNSLQGTHYASPRSFLLRLELRR